MSTATKRGWWLSAPNPACHPWCERTHEADEFTVGGVLTCTQTIKDEGWFSVEVARDTAVPAGGEAPGVVEIGPVVIWETINREFVELTFDEVEQYANAIIRGARAARAIAEAGE